ncbi:3-hydroxyacyl-CoA dehydrogenase NAD-binding domain-containing protein [Flavobacteriaceae bacterium]|jgi:3-hydroxybutyryl-CoA dehydrogenase|nr:3-hydroxyacyl-CoA dehydrogenase NAD-binding domain-containing protein [Flavobacteriaceae bacterium]MDA7724591.1 3-hydroxyacyl-CoA dehydrogenase NAD-binding domain-containing protein [Flavobacteriaceae bacterium]MDA7727603.1 3-hydroxyacyl-CoA dehydrogenase NAD-binding domain-containing protein [Flavobacteriaceae bacterium]MDA7848760.1 3-hydroxyacyl-CoA dehydrogenase NAD-binding domain-containing protein [Flavobacteriaceae bacterium]MDB0003817.1 3-hydroxyacyl-CoA dehydrogenase NAD-binding doma
MKNIAVIGAGAMGNGIAHTFAQVGFKVQLIDVNQTALNTAIATITKNLDRLIAKGKIDEISKTQTLDNISTYTNIPEGVEYASLVVEAATENIDLKLKIFKQLDQACPEDTILATNTSSISITQIAAQTSRPDRVIGMHFMNPVPIMKLVEIITGYNTSKEVIDFIVNLTEKIHKTPVIVNDYPGFVANRILMPMLNEAIETLFTGVAGVKEIDTVMKLGMAHPMGPLELADFIGLDVCLSILEVMYDGFKNPKYAPNPLLINMVRAGKYGVKTGEGFYDYSKERKAVIVAAQFL